MISFNSWDSALSICRIIFLKFGAHGALDWKYFENRWKKAILFFFFSGNFRFIPKKKYMQYHKYCSMNEHLRALNPTTLPFSVLVTVVDLSQNNLLERELIWAYMTPLPMRGNWRSKKNQVIQIYSKRNICTKKITVQYFHSKIRSQKSVQKTIIPSQLRMVCFIKKLLF